MNGPRMDGVGGVGTPAEATVSSGVALVIAWAIVGIPAVWGVAQTVIKSLALFR